MNRLSAAPRVLCATTFLVGRKNARASGATSSAAPDAVARLHDLFDREWAWRLKQSPELATQRRRARRRRQAVGPARRRRWRGRRRRARPSAPSCRRSTATRLPAAEQANYDIFATQLRERVESYGFGEQYLTINADSGFYSGFPLIWQSMPFQSVKGYENYIARLRAFPRYMDQNIALMREGLKRGMTPPKVTLVGIEKSIQPLASSTPSKSALWTPFTRMPPQIPAGEQERLLKAGRDAMLEGGRAGLRPLPRVHDQGVPAQHARDARRRRRCPTATPTTST